MGLERYPGLKAFLVDVGALAESDVRSPNALSNNTISARRVYGAKGRWRGDAELVAEMIGAVDVKATDLITQSRQTLGSSTSSDDKSNPSDSGNSEKGRQQMATLASYADSHAPGTKGLCWPAVWRAMMKVGYGNLSTRNGVDINSAGAADPVHFAATLTVTELNRLGLKRLNLYSPYQAPRGAIVAVRPFGKKGRTPGTFHLTAGDISVAMGDGRFVNDHRNQGYSPPSFWEPGNDHLLGIYVPV